MQTMQLLRAASLNDIATEQKNRRFAQTMVDRLQQEQPTMTKANGHQHQSHIFDTGISPHSFETVLPDQKKAGGNHSNRAQSRNQFESDRMRIGCLSDLDNAPDAKQCTVNKCR